MPFFKFHFVEASRMAGVSRRMADRLQETDARVNISCSS